MKYRISVILSSDWFLRDEKKKCCRQYTLLGSRGGSLRVGRSSWNNRHIQILVSWYDNEFLACLMTDNHLGLFTNCLIMFCTLVCTALCFYTQVCSLICPVFFFSILTKTSVETSVWNTNSYYHSFQNIKQSTLSNIFTPHWG